MIAQRRGGTVVAAASSEFYTREFSNRLGKESIVIQTGSRGTVTDRAVIRDQMKQMNMKANTVVWAEPMQEDLVSTLSAIKEVLLPESQLLVITSNWLAERLPEWRGLSEAPAASRAGQRQTAAYLYTQGFTIAATHSYHGPVSIFWSYASRLMGVLGRFDMADRCRYRMRVRFLTHRWESHLSTVSIIAAKPDLLG